MQPSASGSWLSLLICSRLNGLVSPTTADPDTTPANADSTLCSLFVSEARAAAAETTAIAESWYRSH